MKIKKKKLYTFLVFKSYLEYPSSEERDLAHVAVRLDRMECGAVVGPALADACEAPLLPLLETVVLLFMHWYSSFGNSLLPSCSINSCEKKKYFYTPI